MPKSPQTRKKQAQARLRSKKTSKCTHTKRHYHPHPAALVAVSMAIATGAVVSQQMTATQGPVPHEAAPQLLSLKINALDPVDTQVGKSVRLTAEGYYGTVPIPVQAVWRLIQDADTGRLTCDAAAYDCSFEAQKAGHPIVEAEVNRRKARVELHIKDPQRADTGREQVIRVTFEDDVPQWANDSVVRLANQGIIRGYSDGRFGAGDSLTRAQFITILYRTLIALRLIEEQECTAGYRDVPKDHFAYDATCTFRTRNWSTRLRYLEPDAVVSRAEAAGYVSRFLTEPLLLDWEMTLQELLDRGAPFDDVPRDHPAYRDSAVVYGAGIMTGTRRRIFTPEATLNRAQAAAMVDRILETIDDINLERL